MFEHADRFLMAALQFVVVRHPKRASQKRSFSVRQAVDRRILCVASDKTISHETRFNRLDRPLYARIIGFQKSNQRHHEDAGVEMFGAVILHKRIHTRIETLLANLLVDGIAKSFPTSY